MNQGNRKHLRILALTSWLAMALFAGSAQAYIGPGAGFAILGSFMVLFVSMLLAFGTILAWPIRALIRLFYKRRALTKAQCDRVIVLGLDGFDPELAQRFIGEGKMPTFKKLQDEGCFSELGTTTPSISPVAWSTFQTGCDPSKHNIYDFLARDKATYLSVLSSTDIRAPERILKIGRYRIPLGRPTMKILRKSVPFWKILGDKRIFSSIIRVPITFPPEKFNGISLSAMCTPDLRGTQGTFSFFTTEKIEGDATQGVKIPVERKGNVIEASITGPANSLIDGEPEMTLALKVTLDDAAKTATFKVGDEEFTLREKEYSDWVRLEFKAGLGIKVAGIARFCIQELSPEFKLYMTPIHMDPAKPAMPISHPFTYAVYLAKKFGPYATLGLAEDTWALNERVIDEQTFLKQAWLIHEEREQQFFDALEKNKEGLVVTVFDATDRIQHMFMRYLDPTHPALEGMDRTAYANTIEDLYVRMDDLLKRTLEHVGPRTLLMVISDHGFKNFRRGINLNSWLYEHGYLHLKEGATKSRDWFQDVDWSKTKAFALGLTGMYINLEGREAKGIVQPGEEEAALKDEISAKLLELFDPKDEKKPIRRIFDAKKIMKGPYVSNSPDLLIGYEIGYRASWDCAVGKVDDVVVEDNTKSWSGDHCIDPALVPGVFFCNRKIDKKDPGMVDLAPTILQLFGVDKPMHMDGESMFAGDPFDDNRGSPAAKPKDTADSGQPVGAEASA